MKTKIVTRRQLIRDVAAKWRKQYPVPKEYYLFDVNEVHAKLLALDVETATSADVEAIIGNDSWTDLKCDGCERHDREAVVIVGEEPDYETSTASLCRECVQAANEAMTATAEGR